MGKSFLDINSLFLACDKLLENLVFPCHKRERKDRIGVNVMFCVGR